LALDQTLAALLGKPGTTGSGTFGAGLSALLASFGGGSAGFSAGGGTAPILHRGGIVGSFPSQSRADNMAAYANAPRLHSGLASDEFRAILKRGETVIPAGYGGRGGAGMTSRIEVGVRLVDDMLDARIVNVSDPRIQAHVERNNARVPGIVTNAKRRGRV